MARKSPSPASTDKPKSVEAYALRVNCTDDLVAKIEFLNDDQEPFSHILLSQEVTDMMLCRLMYIQQQMLGLIPNTTTH